jgi:hypothetical protein
LPILDPGVGCGLTSGSGTPLLSTPETDHKAAVSGVANGITTATEEAEARHAAPEVPLVPISSYASSIGCVTRGTRWRQPPARESFEPL